MPPWIGLAEYSKLATERHALVPTFYECARRLHGQACSTVALPDATCCTPVDCIDMAPPHGHR